MRPILVMMVLCGLLSITDSANAQHYTDIDGFVVLVDDDGNRFGINGVEVRVSGESEVLYTTTHYPPVPAQQGFFGVEFWNEGGKRLQFTPPSEYEGMWNIPDSDIVPLTPEILDWTNPEDHILVEPMESTVQFRIYDCVDGDPDDIVTPYVNCTTRLNGESVFHWPSVEPVTGMPGVYTFQAWRGFSYEVGFNAFPLLTVNSVDVEVGAEPFIDLGIVSYVKEGFTEVTVRTEVDGAGIPGVTLVGLPGDPDTPVTGPSGQRTVTVPCGWNGVVTPTLTGYQFDAVTIGPLGDPETYVVEGEVSVGVTSPELDGSTVWVSGSTQVISWTLGTQESWSSLKILYRLDPSESWQTLTEPTPASGSYSWSPVPGDGRIEAGLRFEAVSSSGQTHVVEVPLTITDILYVGTEGVHDPVDFEVLQLAIDAATDGTTVFLHEGIYADPEGRDIGGVTVVATAFIDKPIRLTGASPLTTTLIAQDGGAGIFCHEVAGEGLRIDNMTIKDGDVGIKAWGAAPYVTGCFILDCQVAGVWIGSGPGEPTSLGSSGVDIGVVAIADVAGAGILSFAGGTVSGATVSGCGADNENNYYVGGLVFSALYGTVDPLIVENCSFMDNQNMGLMAFQGAELEISDSKIGFTSEPAEPTGYGVYFGGGESGTIRDSWVYWYGGGVFAGIGFGAIEVSGNSIGGCGNAMELQGLQAASISRNLITANVVGVYCGSTTPSLTDNNLWNNEFDYQGDFGTPQDYQVDPILCATAPYNDMQVRSDSPMLQANGAPLGGIGAGGIGCAAPGGGGGSGCNKYCPTLSNRFDNVVPTVSSILAASPNPFRAGSTVHFATAEPSEPEIRVFDVTGRQLLSETLAPHPAGTWMWTWDGRTDNGESLAQGVYYLKMVVNSAVLTHKVVKLQ